MGLFDKIADKLDNKTPHEHGGTRKLLTLVYMFVFVLSARKDLACKEPTCFCGEAAGRTCAAIALSLLLLP